MGFGHCRFGDGKVTNTDYYVVLEDMQAELLVCGLWRHYAEDHNCLPPDNVRNIVMNADSRYAKSQKIRYYNKKQLKRYQVLFVEKKNGGFDHKIGKKPDTAFIDKLEDLISKGKKITYRGGK